MAMANMSPGSTKGWKTSASGRDPRTISGLQFLSLRFASFRLGQSGTPVSAMKHECIGGEGEQADADHHQAERNGPAEEDQVVAVRHDQRLAQALLQDRRDHEAEHQRSRVKVELAQRV